MTSPMETRSDEAIVARVKFIRKMESSHICFEHRRGLVGHLATLEDSAAGLRYLDAASVDQGRRDG